MRVLAIRVGLVDPHHVSNLQAAADEASPRWFSANLNISTLLALVTTFVGLVSGYYSLVSTNSRQDTQIAANAAAIHTSADKFDQKVVSREEYQNRNRDVDAKLLVLQNQVQQQQQQQLYTVLLGRALAAQGAR